MSTELEKRAELMEKRYIVLFAVMLGGIMGPIDASIVNVILPTIAAYFSAPIALLPVGTADSPAHHQQPAPLLRPPR